MEVCIVPDNISSMVHAYGLRLLTSEGWHPAYDYFCSRKEACVITMENLRGVIRAQASGEGCILLKTRWSSVIWWSG